MAFDDWTAPLWDGTSSGGGETLSPAPGWTQTRREPVSYETFREMVSEEMDLLPQYVFDELSGGVLVEERRKLSPDSVADDLFILGLYKWGGLGKQVTLYYGSFVEILGDADQETYRAQIRETLRHEFRHHMETRAGEFGKGSLLEEDLRRRERYLEARKGERRGVSGKSCWTWFSRPGAPSAAGRNRAWTAGAAPGAGMPTCGSPWQTG